MENLFSFSLPLVSALHRLTLQKPDHQQCQLAFIAEFAITAQHTPGAENVVADALSRPPTVVAKIITQS